MMSRSFSWNLESSSRRWIFYRTL